MKKLLTILSLSTSIIACKETEKKQTEAVTDLNQDHFLKALEDSANFTTIEWLDSTYQDLGKVEEGQVVDVTFRFKNTGDKPLIIADITVSCGCTTIPEKPKNPFDPGQEGVIKAKFDSKNMAGERLREVFVKANTINNRTHKLTLRVDVVKK